MEVVFGSCESCGWQLVVVAGGRWHPGLASEGRGSSSKGAVKRRGRRRKFDFYFGKIFFLTYLPLCG